LAIDPTLDQLSREELILRARTLGARRPEVMTRVELRDEIVRLGESDPTVRRRTRGWLGVARDLVASVVDSGLNLPGAAAAIRGEGKPEHEWQGPPPVATVTLAEIYVAQGHTDRALSVLNEVLASEPDHAAALALRGRLDRRGEIPRAAPPARIAPETEELTPGRGVRVEVALPQEAPPASSDEGPLSVPVPLAAPVPVPLPESAPVAISAPEETPPVRQEENPFPDEPSPLTADHSVYPAEATPFPEEHEEQTVGGVISVLPEQSGCAVVTTSHGVEVFYELPGPMAGAVLRVVWFAPGPSGIERGERDLPVDAGYHRVAVEGIAAHSEVRAALGVPGPDGFAPLAVAWVYQARAGSTALEFAPPGEEPRTLRARVDARVVALR
jgi:hypothetical protein